MQKLLLILTLLLPLSVSAYGVDVGLNKKSAPKEVPVSLIMEFHLAHKTVFR